MNFNQRKALNLIFILLIGMAAFLRLYNIEYAEFKGDEARNSFKALKFVMEGEFPLTSSISSTGINEPPIFMYILSIPFFFSTDPVLATVFIAILNIAGILLCFILVKQYFSHTAAIIASAFYSVNPWQVLFSRKIWTQNLLAPFVILFFFLIFKAINEKKKEYYIYAFLALGIVLQLHLSALYFLAVLLFISILYYKELNGNYLSLGIAALLLTFVPYFVFQVKNNFVDFYTFASYFKSEPIFHKSAFTLPILLFSTNGFQYSLGNNYAEFNQGIYKIPFLDYLSIAILVSSLFCVFYKNFNKLTAILVFSLVSGIFYLFTNKAPVLYEHYFNSILPLMFIITGIALSVIIKSTPDIIKYFLVFIVGILVIYQFAFSFRILNFIKEKKCIQGDYGVPYFYRKKLIEEGIKDFSTGYIEKNIHSIHLNTCDCVKCDLPATHFIIKHLRKDYLYWPSPED